MLRDSSPTRARFESNLLGTLGAGVFVGPNTIDFKAVFQNIDVKLVEVCDQQRYVNRYNYSLSLTLVVVYCLCCRTQQLLAR